MTSEPALSGRISFKEPETKTLCKEHHLWKPITATPDATLLQCEMRRGKTGHSYTALSHSANAQNVSDRDRRRQRTMAIRGRRLKLALQRILRHQYRRSTVREQTNGKEFK